MGIHSKWDFTLKGIHSEWEFTLNGNSLWMEIHFEWDFALNGNSLWMGIHFKYEFTLNGIYFAWNYTLHGNSLWMGIHFKWEFTLNGNSPRMGIDSACQNKYIPCLRSDWLVSSSVLHILCFSELHSSMESKWQMVVKLDAQVPRMRKKSLTGSGKKYKILLPKGSRWEQMENLLTNIQNIK